MAEVSFSFQMNFQNFLEKMTRQPQLEFYFWKVIILIFQGWKGEDEGSLTDFGQETTQVTVTVKGKNVGYGSTCEFLIQSALVILQENEKIPGTGGVLTPGYAFKDTSLVRRLNDNGITFDVLVEDLIMK